MAGKYEPLMRDMVWSYSRIKCFSSCPYKFYMTYLEPEENRPEKVNKFYAEYGSFIHKLIERYYLGEIDKEDMVVEFLTGFNENVPGTAPSDKILDSYVQAGVNYLNSFEPFPYNMIEVEKKVEFEIKGNKFVGYIDFLGGKDGDYIIIDNKSRNLKPRSKRKKPTENDKTLDEMLKQLYLYAYAVKLEYGKYPTKLAFNCFKNNVYIEEDFDETKCEEALNYVTEMINLIKQEEEFTVKPDFFYCRYLRDLSHECWYEELRRETWEKNREVKP